MTPALLALALAAPRIVAPGPEALTTQARLHVFVRADGAFALRVNGQDVPCAPGDGGVEAGRAYALRDGGTLAHCTAPLRPGGNTLAVSDAQGAAQQRVTRYVTTGALPEDTDVAGFGPGTLHRPDVEAVCAGCHRMTSVTDAGLPSTDACGDCHGELTRRTNTHGPVMQAVCLQCHDAKSEPSRYAVRWPIEETCFACHVDLRLTMDSKAFRHGPAAAGRCTTCHDPHGTDQPFWLKKRAFELCTNCHTEKRDERHVVVGFVYGDSHPLQGRPHPLKSNTEFACPACHNPHAAQARFLWQFDVTKRETLCRTCHQK